MCVFLPSNRCKEYFFVCIHSFWHHRRTHRSTHIPGGKCQHSTIVVTFLENCETPIFNACSIQLYSSQSLSPCSVAFPCCVVIPLFCHHPPLPSSSLCFNKKRIVFEMPASLLSLALPRNLPWSIFPCWGSRWSSDKLFALCSDVGKQSNWNTHAD